MSPGLRCFGERATERSATVGGTHHHHHNGHRRPGPPDEEALKRLRCYEAREKEVALGNAWWDAEVKRSLEIGLPGSDSIDDKTISTFSRTELPHFAGINTFMSFPYLEDVREVGDYDVAILGAPFDMGTTYRSGTRFGPQANGAAALAAIITGAATRLAFFALVPTTYGVENTLLYIPNAVFTPAFDVLPTLISPMVALATYAVVTLTTTGAFAPEWSAPVAPFASDGRAMPGLTIRPDRAHRREESGWTTG